MKVLATPRLGKAVLVLLIVLAIGIPTIMALDEVVDDYTDLSLVSYQDDVVRNSTFNAMELNGSSFSPDYENYTTFTEIDEDGDITVTDLSITFDSLRRDAITRVQYDYGANFFDEFQHEQDVNITDVEAGDASTRSHPLIWCVANALGQYVGVVSASDSIGIWTQQNGATDDKYQIQITWREGGVLQGQDIGITRNVNEAVYLTINRTDDDFWVRIYSDASRSTLNETLNLDNIANTQFRYFYGLLGIGSANDPADHISGVIENLWFGGVSGGYELDGYFNTTNLLVGLSYNATVLLTNTTIPSGSINVEISPDGSTWSDLGTLSGGYEATDLRTLGITDAIIRYNYTRGANPNETPRLYQTRLIHEGPGAGVTDATPWLAIGIILALSMILLADRLRK